MASKQISEGYETIPAVSLKPVSSVTLPVKPIDTTNYGADIDGTQATIDAGNESLKPEPEATPTAIDTYIAGLEKPSSLSEQYSTDYKASGIDTAQQDFLAKEKIAQVAKSKLAGINARLAGINAEAEAQQLSLEGQGRGQTMDFLNRQQSEIGKQKAIRALPIQAEALIAQAEVQAAQGDVELAQNTIRLAQDRLNTVFGLHTKDIDNAYTYKKDVITAVYSHATAKEKTLLDAKLKEEERIYQERKDNVNNAQAISKIALDNGQASLASQITALDPKSKTYTQDLARLQGQIRVVKNLGVAEGGMSIGGGTGITTSISAITGKPLSEGERKAQGYAQRTIDANKVINNLENKFTRARSYVGQILPNILKTSERQEYEQAQRNFVNAVLRPESGAVINPDEFENARIQYFAQPGDSKSVIQQKKLNRQTKIESLLVEGGASITGKEEDPLGILL